MPKVPLLLTTVLLLLSTACSADPEEIAAQDSCEALGDANWDRLDEASNELTDEGEYGDLLNDFYPVIDVSNVDPMSDQVSNVELQGRYAIENTREAFEDAWTTCTDVSDSMPAVQGSEYEDAWDELAMTLFYIFGTEN